ncbi:MAG: OmpH/Skp family outer membrane protein [Gammaproteobacteria bacterium]
MKRLLTLALVALSPFALADNHSAASAGESIMVIDMPQIMQQSPEVQKMAKTVQADLKKRQEAIIAKQKEVQQAKAKLQKNGSVMSKNERSSLEKQAMMAEREMNRMKEDYFQDARLAQNQVIQSVMDKVQKSARRLAEQRHIDVVLPKRSVIYANKNVDITAEVLKDIKSVK